MSGLVQSTPYSAAAATKYVPDPSVEALKGSVAHLHQSHKEITVKLAAVMEKLSVFETIVKDKKSK